MDVDSGGRWTYFFGAFLTSAVATLFCLRLHRFLTSLFRFGFVNVFHQNTFVFELVTFASGIQIVVSKFEISDHHIISELARTNLWGGGGKGRGGYSQVFVDFAGLTVFAQEAT